MRVSGSSSLLDMTSAGFGAPGLLGKTGSTVGGHLGSMGELRPVDAGARWRDNPPAIRPGAIDRGACFAGGPGPIRESWLCELGTRRAIGC
jgi:hypothetical protein